jgi:hypothetical protein
MADSGSKAKFIRESLDKIVGEKVPQMAPEQFERMFSVKLEPEQIASMTFGELMMRQLVLKACTGNDRSITETLDRLLGKAVQTTESVVKSYSYHDLLVQLQSEDPAAPKRAEVVDVPPARSIIAPPRELPKTIQAAIVPDDEDEDENEAELIAEIFATKPAPKTGAITFDSPGLDPLEDL